MRIGLIIVVLCSQLSHSAELPLFFDSGANFTGTITRHKIQGDPTAEERFSRVGEKITLRMLTMAGKAIVVAVQKVGTDKAFVSTFDTNNDDKLFSAAKAVLEEKTRQRNVASRYEDPFFRSSVYEPRDYVNKQWIVAARLLTESHPGFGPTVVNVILHPLDKDTVEGEFLVRNPDKTIIENLWFDVKREVVAPAVPPPPVPKP